MTPKYFPINNFHLHYVEGWNVALIFKALPANRNYNENNEE